MHVNHGPVLSAEKRQNPHGDGKYLPVLDGWRAVAIILVLLFHGFYNSKLKGYPRLENFGELTGRTGALGVLVFFCISGYLITQRLLAESRTTGMFSLRAFYIKRIFRILPPLVTYLLVALGLYWLGIIRLNVCDWAAPLFLTNYISGGSWFTSHFWSLSVEEHFYLFWPCCVLIVGWRRAMWAGIFLISAIAVWRPWKLAHVTHQAGTLQHTDMRLDYILMGAIVALLTAFYPRTVILFKRIGTPPGLLTLFLLLLLSTSRSRVDLRSLQAILLTLIVCASTIADSRFIRWLLTGAPVLFVGRISYSLYVWQQLLLAPSSNPFWSSPLALPLKFAAALLVAYISFRFVEKPFIRYGRSFLATSEAPDHARAKEVEHI
jgi:peptidoglycan/LPS O-acetylase OafA/YrhL